MSHKDDGAALAEVFLSLKMNLGHKRAGRVDYRELPRFRRSLDGLRYAMRAENRNGALRNLVNLVDKAGTLRLQVFDDMFVMYDLMPDEDGRVVLLQRALHDRYGANHTRAKSARLREHHPCRTAARNAFLHHSTPCLRRGLATRLRLAADGPTNGWVTPFPPLSNIPEPACIFLNDLSSKDGLALGLPRGKQKPWCTSALICLPNLTRL